MQIYVHLTIFILLQYTHAIDNNNNQSEYDEDDVNRFFDTEQNTTNDDTASTVGTPPFRDRYSNWQQTIDKSAVPFCTCKWLGVFYYFEL
jgi:hypothetical protein